ncbi:hypothetical protein VTI74DRAFT_8678 [Chaetomium olivicolor]
MSADVQDRDLARRKRSHEDYLNQETCVSVTQTVELSLSDKENDVPSASLRATASPGARSSSLSERACSPIDPHSPIPLPTPAPSSKPTASTQPTSTKAKTSTQKSAGEPPKKKRLTGAEKAARDAAIEAEKRKKQEEREQKRRQKEEAEKLKAEQKAEKEQEKKQKEQEKKQRAEEREKKKREKEEEEAKKSRSQLRLTSMFNCAPTTPKKEAAASSKSDQSNSKTAGAKGEAREASLYDQIFKPFFIKEHVRLASNPFEVDEETREAKTNILDEYLSGKRQEPNPRFDPLESLQIPYKVRRGRVYPSVRKIMEEFDALSSNAPGEVSTESQNAQIRHTLEALKSVPVKSIKFREDVRPPYIGTISGLPPGGKSLRKLARNPISQDILELNYGYDSEAEWQEEEGEDVDDLDDEEEEADLDEDMADFLDDSEDVGPARMGFSGSMEPEATGPCWEDRKRQTAEPKLYKYRIEFILESLEHHNSIDPFSTAYWEPPKSKATAISPGNGTSNASKPASTSPSATNPSSSNPGASNPINPMAPPPPPSDAFQALNSTSASTGSKKSQQPLPADMQQKLKELVRNMPTLSKVGVIELFAAQNPGCARAQIKSSFDALFEKAGKVFKVKGE